MEDDDYEIISDTESIEDIIDEEWLKEFEFIESNYDKFYNTDNENIKITCFFYKDRKIERIQNEIYNLNKNNELSQEELLKIIKSRSNKDYKLVTMLRYNIDLKPKELLSFKNNENEDVFKYMNRIKSIETIYFMPSIQMFKDLNNLYLFFEFKKENTKNFTKKINYNPKLKKKLTKKNIR
tara:strand:+ start:963 stop:1505 length:543 start_codon:yes stop_codon:yes gene_type:complete